MRSRPRKKPLSVSPHVTLTGAVQTSDGPGVILGMEMRKNTNGGPGTRQYRVQLADGRIRNYNTALRATRNP